MTNWVLIYGKQIYKKVETQRYKVSARQQRSVDEGSPEALCDVLRQRPGGVNAESTEQRKKAKTKAMVYLCSTTSQTYHRRPP